MTEKEILQAPTEVLERKAKRARHLSTLALADCDPVDAKRWSDEADACEAVIAQRKERVA